jgi:hypothetical protein
MEGRKEGRKLGALEEGPQIFIMLLFLAVLLIYT